MSLEKAIQENTKAVERLTGVIFEIITGKPAEVKYIVTSEAPKVSKKEEIPAPPVAKKEEVPTSPPAPKQENKKENLMTLEEANKTIMVEYKRLLATRPKEQVLEAINGVFKEYDAQGLTSVDAENYKEVIEKIQALK